MLGFINDIWKIWNFDSSFLFQKFFLMKIVILKILNFPKNCNFPNDFLNFVANPSKYYVKVLLSSISFIYPQLFFLKNTEKHNFPRKFWKTFPMSQYGIDFSPQHLENASRCNKFQDDFYWSHGNNFPIFPFILKSCGKCTE